MSSTGARMIKNTSVLVISQMITWVLTLLVTLFLPRYLGPEANGEIVIASSIWAIASVFVGFGMDTYLIKLIARNPQQLYTGLGTSLGLRVIFYFASLVPVSILLWTMGMSAEGVVIVHLIGVSSLFASLASGTQAALQGLEIMEYISVSNIASKAVNTVLCIGALLVGLGAYAVTVVMILAALVLLVIQLYFLHRHQPLRLGFDRAEVWPVLKSSLPYVATALVTVGYAQVNVLLIGAMMSPTEAGWYGAALQLFGTLLFLPVVFAMALFPQMTRSFTSDADAPAKMLRKSVEIVLLVGVPVGLGLMVVAEPLVLLIFGPEYGPTGPVLQALGLAIIFMYLNVLISQYFTSVDRQNVWTVVIAVSVGVMSALTIVLVPWFQDSMGNGALGGAASMLISEACMVVIGALLLRGELVTRQGLWVVGRTLAAGIVMMVVAWYLRDAFIALPIAAGAVTYVAMIALLRVVPAEDLAVMRQFVGNALARLRPRRGADALGGD